MNRLIAALFVTAGLIASPVYAADPVKDAADMTKPALAEIETLSLEAQVTAIDKATRKITLKLGDQSYTVTAGPEVRNFAQIKKGDLVIATHTRAVVVKVLAGGGLRSTSESLDGARTKPGQKPGAAVEKITTVVADIVSVNQEQGLVTLKGTSNNLVEYKVKDKSNLANVKAGDQVEIQLIEAVAVAVEPKPVAK